MRAMRMLLVVAVAVLALALPTAAGAFVPPNPAVHYKAQPTSTVGFSSRDAGVAILCGVATVLLAVGIIELTRVHDQGHRPTPTTA
ncbi:MAG TPA: hypothetical protein VMT59_04715 [Gaiellaceae bacterium]|nr:hypothetical protein [Gaiellaceae bacterium]